MFVFYETSTTTYIIYDGVQITEKKKKPNSGYFLIKPYEATKEDLIKYYNDMEKWLNQLCDISKLAYDKLEKLNYDTLIMTLFKIYRNDKHIKYDTITYDESIFLNGCFNGGLNSCEKGTYKNVNAYDFSKFYPNILGGDRSKKQIPIKEGKFYNLKELPEKLEYGVYRVVITSNSPNISKIFAFNINNYYTHEDINFMKSLNHSKYYDINIDLIKDNEPNSLIYTDLIETKTIFIRYVKKLQEILSKDNKNRLCKYLLSSLWGKLSQKGATRLLTLEKYEELENKDDYYLINVKTIIEDGEFNYQYKILHKNRLQLSNYRLKTFLTSFGRVKMGSKIKYNANNVIRVCTDGVIFNNTTNLKGIETKEFIKDTKYNNKDITIVNNKKVIIV